MEKFKSKAEDTLRNIGLHLLWRVKSASPFPLSQLLTTSSAVWRSQNPGLAEAGRAFCVPLCPCVPAPAPAAPPRAGCPGPWPGGFWRAPGRRPHSLWAACASAPSPATDVQREPPGLQFVPMASCPGTGHHWEELHPLCTLPSCIN